MRVVQDSDEEDVLSPVKEHNATQLAMGTEQQTSDSSGTSRAAVDLKLVLTYLFRQLASKDLCSTGCVVSSRWDTESGRRKR